MNRNSLKVFALAVFSAGLAPAAAHNGDRVFPISYLSEETLALLNQDDGVVEDWLDAVGEPTLTPLDFNLWTGMRKTSTFDRHNPSSLDFRIWMGWTPDGRIHVAGQFVDDLYVNEYDPLEWPYWYPEFHDSVSLLVDGDHTGEEFFWAQMNELDEALQTNRQAQMYENIAIAPSGGPRVVLFYTSVGGLLTFDEIDQPVDWMVQPPFAQGGGGVFGENPTIWVTEFYVTCFDLLDHLNPENSVVSELAERKVIGFDLLVRDYDTEPVGPHAFYQLKDPDDAEENAEGADFFVDGLLLGPDDDFGDSAVQSTSWARIKASLDTDLRNRDKD